MIDVGKIYYINVQDKNKKIIFRVYFVKKLCYNSTRGLIRKQGRGIMARVLVCDDAAFMRMALIKILKEGGHTAVAEAGDGEAAVRKYKEYHPDVVLMDITMPEVDGLEATRQITEYDPNALVIMVSAMGQQGKVFEAIASGAKDFIVKPFDPNKILECIDKYINV